MDSVTVADIHRIALSLAAIRESMFVLTIGIGFIGMSLYWRGRKPL